MDSSEELQLLVISFFSSVTFYDVWTKFSFCHSRHQYIQGFEVPLLVLFTTHLEGSHNERVISRCKSKLVVICDGKSVERFYAPGHYSNSYSMKIEVSGSILCLFQVWVVYGH